MSTSHEEKPYSADTLPAELQVADSELEKSPQGVDPGKVFRKLDTRLLPLVTLLFLLSFLDRTNIGNAKIAGLVSDLHLTGLQYNLCAAMFFKLSRNLALKLSRPSRWLPFIMLCWGIVMMSMAFVKSFVGLLVARLFLGVTEAGFFPGVTFYLCTWYPRTAQAQRISIVSGAASLAGAFGGLLAFGIEKMAGIRGLAGWSWIFLLEGLGCTFCISLSSSNHSNSVQYPENATFLTAAERTWLVETMKKDTKGLSKAFKWKFLWQALRDPHTYLMVGIYLFILIPAYSFVLFLPTIIAELGFAASTAQLLSIPPNAAACILTVLAGILSDRARARGPFILGGCVTALVGYVVLFATKSAGAGYAGTMVAACGLFPGIALTLAWTGGNTGGDVKKAVVIAMVIGVSNLGGIVLCITAMLEFARLNKKKDAIAAGPPMESEGKRDFEDMGDESPLFRCAFPRLRQVIPRSP
ncbi:hypothetical protein V8D89_005024 [Ganoderma adspersum]